MSKFSVFAFTILFSISSLHSLANAASDSGEFLQAGFSVMKGQVTSQGRNILPQDKSCPAGGTDLQQDMFWIKDSLFSATQSVANLMQSVAPTAENKKAENNRCGKCQQNNLVSSIASIAPVRTATNDSCEGRPTETFSVQVQSQSQVKRFTEDLLKGRSSDGKKLLAGCPNPCAYYINTAQTPMADGRTQVTMTVQCGQPRQDSIFTAIYQYNAGLLHQWSCSKAQ